VRQGYTSVVGEESNPLYEGRRVSSEPQVLHVVVSIGWTAAWPRRYTQHDGKSMSTFRNWRLKGAIQKGLSALPGGCWVNDQLQRRAGDLRAFEKNIDMKVADWTGIISYLKAAGRAEVGGATILEIGSGWYPTLPLCFSLAGVRCCHTVDINRHLHEGLTFRMCKALGQRLDAITAETGLSMALVRERYQRLSGTSRLENLLSEAGICYHAPADGANLSWLPEQSLDLVYSNSVLEHVPPEVIQALMREARRVLKDDGVMVHAVACNDHYAHFDRGISYVNYLQFPEREWRFWNNRLNYQNRLRAPDFLGMAEDAGFRIIHEARAVRPGVREALSSMRIAPDFARYSSEDLASTSVDFVAMKQAPGCLGC
jgi:SAM-dependent methyltransferase